MRQLSEEWFAERAVRITASNMPKVMAGKKTKGRRQYRIDLMSALLGMPRRVEENKPWFEHGPRLEPIARATYAFKKQRLAHECGFYIHPRLLFIGASPDGENTAKTIGLEIKSRESYKEHKKCVDRGNNLLPRYKPQVYTQMMCAGYKSVDFVSYFQDPQDPNWTEIHIVDVQPDWEYMAKIEAAAQAFWDEVQSEIRKLKG